jgi:transcriptional regulator with XRE-family HTH domain
MTMLSPWPAIIADLQREQSMSTRELARLSKVNRSTLRKFMQHKTSIGIHHLEGILAVFDHELEVIPLDIPKKEEAACPTLHPASASAVVRLLTAPAVRAE